MARSPRENGDRPEGRALGKASPDEPIQHPLDPLQPLDPVEPEEDVEVEEPVEPTFVVYPLGILLWAFVGVLILTTIPPEARNSSTGIVLFLLPLGMAVLSAFLNLFTRPGRPPAVRAFARTMTFACLWPFVAWGQWDSRARRKRG